MKPLPPTRFGSFAAFRTQRLTRLLQSTRVPLQLESLCRGSYPKQIFMRSGTNVAKLRLRSNCASFTNTSVSNFATKRENDRGVCYERPLTPTLDDNPPLARVTPPRCARC